MRNTAAIHKSRSAARTPAQCSIPRPQSRCTACFSKGISGNFSCIFGCVITCWFLIFYLLSVPVGGRRGYCVSGWITVYCCPPSLLTVMPGTDRASLLLQRLGWVRAGGTEGLPEDGSEGDCEGRESGSHEYPCRQVHPVCKGFQISAGDPYCDRYGYD